MNDTPPNTLEEFLLLDELMLCLKKEGILPKSCFVGDAHLQVMCTDRAQANRIKESGAWDAVSDVFQSELTDEKGIWFIEISLALLANKAHLENKAKSE